MHHVTPLLGIIIGGLVLAFILGAIAHRLRMSPLIGYLLAGIVVGPFTPGYVAHQGLANELAELGVILLMFGVGLHFSVRDLLSVRRVAIPGACWLIAGLALTLPFRRRELLLATAAACELFAFGVGYNPAVRMTDVPPEPQATAGRNSGVLLASDLSASV